jgi:hypothetical protein
MTACPVSVLLVLDKFRAVKILEDKMVGDIISTAYTAGKDLISSVQRFKEIKMTRAAMLRAYHFEVQSNLDLLNFIDTTKLKELRINSPEAFSVVNNLEIQFAASILFCEGSEGQDLYTFLSKKGNVAEKDEDNQSENDINKTILEAILFTVRKVTILQKLSSFCNEKDNDIFNAMRLGVRLSNIKTHLNFIRIALDEMNNDEGFLGKAKCS